MRVSSLHGAKKMVLYPFRDRLVAEIYDRPRHTISEKNNHPPTHTNWRQLQKYHISCYARVPIIVTINVNSSDTYNTVVVVFF